MLIITTKKNYEAEISKRAMEACELVISELGAELHDDLIQRLTVLRLSLDRLEFALSDQKEAEALLASVKTEFNEVTQSIRKTSRVMLPVHREDNSFQDSVLHLCQNLERPGSGNIHFQASGAEIKLPVLVETYLYRIIQELITNAFKHSSAWHVWVRMQWGEYLLILEVEDDGSGISKIPEFIRLLRNKRNTLKMRSNSIRADIDYLPGAKGLLARVRIPI